MSTSGISRIYGFHSGIESQNEEIEVESETYAVAHGYLLVELVEAECTARLFGIFAYGPDVSGIDEECAVELPEQICSIFEVDVELYVARLVDEVDVLVAS